MAEICSVCHLPKTICTCDLRTREQQQIKIRTERKKFKKYATLISGFTDANEQQEVLKYLKKKLACGGTVKDNVIELQGEQKERIKKLLIEKGYLEEIIDA
ncbi:MAG TPA: stress response translation initiation inhibitor YciH [Candidatus Diapherotrites archaeon]|nr:stress response translation initiation inhibitor YciH [Candidatus Diapherotrites archaeon]